MKRFFALTAVAALLASFLLFDTQCIINNDDPRGGNTSTDQTADTTKDSISDTSVVVDTATDSTGDTTTVVDSTTADTSSHVGAQDTGIIYTLTGGGASAVWLLINNIIYILFGVMDWKHIYGE